MTKANKETLSGESEVLVAVAWPYANGERHIGHASSLIPADVIARFHRSIGNHVLMVGGTDEHGTPNKIAAEEQGIDPQEYVDGTSALIRRDFVNLGMSFDWFTRTTSPVHNENAREVFEALADKGYIVRGEMLTSYDTVSDQALADRYVEGGCPFCGAKARGDQCDNCSKLLDPENLIDPVSAKSNNPVAFRESTHYFLDLESLSDKVAGFLSGDVDLRDDARRFSESLVSELRPRSITREIDWGVKLPAKYELSEEERVMYVWFEAVIGYISAAKEWSLESENIESWKSWWQNDSATHIYAMGKDNVPFHTTMWPAMLEGLNEGTDDSWHLPDIIASTGNLNFKDGKFSSSRRNVIYINDIIEAIGPDALRFYCIAAGPETKDSNFSYEDMARKVNDELLAKWGNAVSRTIALLNKNNAGQVPPLPEELAEDASQLLSSLQEGFASIGTLMKSAEFSKSLKKIMELVTELNKFINAHEPWKAYKNDAADANNTMSVVVRAILNLNTMLAPFIPHSSQRVYELFNVTSQSISQPRETISTAHGVNVLTTDHTQSLEWKYMEFSDLVEVFGDTAHLFRKLDAEHLEAEISEKLRTRSLGSIATQPTLE